LNHQAINSALALILTWIQPSRPGWRGALRGPPQARPACMPSRDPPGRGWQGPAPDTCGTCYQGSRGCGTAWLRHEQQGQARISDVFSTELPGGGPCGWRRSCFRRSCYTRKSRMRQPPAASSCFRRSCSRSSSSLCRLSSAPPPRGRRCVSLVLALLVHAYMHASMFETSNVRMFERLYFILPHR
jgi:hypothetical protein